MGTKRRVLTISNMPLRGGLVTAGQQSTLNENQMWRMDNMTSAFDGLVQVRPGIARWGHKIRGIDNSATDKLAFWEDILTRTDWTSVDATSGRVTFTEADGFLQADLRAMPSGTGDWLYYRNVKGAETAPDSNKWAVRLFIKVQNTADPGAVAEPLQCPTITITAGSTSKRRFALGTSGIYYQSGATAWTLIASTAAAVDGAWHTIEIAFDATDDSTTVSIDEGTALEATIAYDASFDTGDLIEFKMNTSDAIEQFAMHLSSVQYSDAGADGFENSRVHDIESFMHVGASGDVTRHILVSAGDYVYTDRGMRKWWFPLLRIVNGRARFVHFRSKLIIFDYQPSGPSAVTYEWDGNTITTLTDMPPCKFGTEHRSRLWTAGKQKHPLRAYFSGSRQSNLWFDPDVDEDETFEEVTQAGYIEIPSKRGDKITGMWGDYYGDLIIGTDKGIWRISGASPQSFQRLNVNGDVGVGGPEAFVQFGNTLWFAGAQGIANLETTEKYGDVQTSLPSGAIQDIWTDNPHINPGINKTYIDRAKMTYDNPNGMVYLSLPELDGGGDISAVYAFNVNTTNWFGRWGIKATALRSIDVAFPVQQVVMIGTADGDVGYFDHTYKGDFDAPYSWAMETPMLDGRSLDPRLPMMMKTWRRIRLFIMPRGEWDFNLSWYSDDGSEKTRENINQNVYNMPVLSSSSTVADNAFRLDVSKDGKLESAQSAAMIEIPLDVRGRWLHCIITGGGAIGEDFALQGYEVDFAPVGYESED